MICIPGNIVFRKRKNVAGQEGRCLQVTSEKTGDMLSSADAFLTLPVEQLPGIGEKRAALLATAGIRSIRDLLFYFPRAYDDRRRLTPVNELCKDQVATVMGEVVSVRPVRLRGRRGLVEVTLQDKTGSVRAVWFGQHYLSRVFVKGKRFLLTGKVGEYKGLVLKNPDYEALSGDEEDGLNVGRIVPIYPLVKGLTQRLLRRLVSLALEQLPLQLQESLPGKIMASRNFPALAEALHDVHFPREMEDAARARERFSYEELLGIQVAVLYSRGRTRKTGSGCSHNVTGPVLRRLRSLLPFTLTDAQERAIQDILSDMADSRPMARLLQGDVGCGKTVVALFALAAAIDGGYQVAFMAPTELLAEQHALTLRQLVDGLGIRLAVLTGSTPRAGSLRQCVAAGEIDVVVGTRMRGKDNAS